MLRRCLFTLSLGLISQGLSAVAVDPIYAPQAPVPVPGFAIKNTANFADLRHNVLELISASKKRVWLITDYLTDGDIVSALFLAKYRKVDVKVFLGRAKQNSYLSRLSYLKGQDIPVFLRPEHGFIAPTLILSDQHLFTVNRDLNAMAVIGQAQMAQVAPTEVKNFVGWFQEALAYPEPTLNRSDPAVGRSHRLSPGHDPKGSVHEPSYNGEQDGSYNYNRSNLSRRAPEGILTQLPRVPVWQKNRDLTHKESAPRPRIPPAPGPGESDNPPRAPTVIPSAPESGDFIWPSMPSTTQPSEGDP